VVKMLPGGAGAGHDSLGWEPKAAFDALAQLDWRSAPGAP